MNSFELNRYNIALKQELENEEKELELKKRLDNFANVSSLEDAQKLAAQILPAKQGITTFYVGNAKCSIINEKETLRICFDSNKEFICYNFS